MAWVAVDIDGDEIIFDDKPERYIPAYWDCRSERLILPKGSIKKLIGRELTCNDEPVKLEENKAS